MSYELKRVKHGMRVHNVWQVKLDKELEFSKGKIRKQIEEEIFDIEDSVADNAKLIFLLMASVKRLYKALPDNIKDNIEDKEMLDTMIDTFDKTQSVADIKYKEEGNNMITRIFDRQAKLGSIVKG